MGQAAGLLLGAAGAVVGGLIGGPMGAEAGFMAGSVLGALLWPPKGPTPPNVRVQDSAYGKWIPMVWGRYRVAGNVIWMGTPHAHGTGGKGMGGKMQGPYTTLSFAVALCRNEIAGINRIWANGQLIYDVSNPSDWQALSGSTSMVTGFTVYYGTETQLPDPTMESYQGTMTPAYRGLAYVVFNELNLQQWGNYLPSFTFEVIAAGEASYRSYTEASYTLASGGGWYFTMCPCLTAQGGVAMMTNGSSAAGVTVVNLSAYGANIQTVLYETSTGGAVPAGWSLAGSVSGNSDVSGGYYGNMWLYPDGTYDSLPNTPEVGFDATDVIIGRSGDDLFLMSYWGGSSSLYRCSIAAGGAVSAQSVIQVNSFYGASADYVYAGNGSTLYQLSRATLAVVQSWTSVPGTAQSSIGYVVDDDHVYLSSGNTLYLFDPATGTSSYLGLFQFVPTSLAVLSPSLVIAATTTGGSAPGSVTLGYLAITTASSTVTLGDIITDVVEDAGLQPSQFDVSQCTDTVIGFASTDNSSPRDILKPLMATYFIDASDSDGMIKFIHRGATPTATIPWDDLGADAKENSDQARNPISETIAQEYDLPCAETLSYLSASTDYQTLTQRAFMGTTTSNLYESMNAPIVLADNDAMARVQAMLWERWSKRRSFKFAAGYKWLALEPGDTINLQQQNGQLIPVRITQVQFDGKGCLSFDADFTVPSIYPVPGSSTYTAQASNALGVPAQAVPYSGPTQLVLMDIPPLRPQDATTLGLYLAADGYASDWPGCLVDMSRDDVNFSQVLSATSAAVVGVAATALGSFGGGNIPDELNAVTISLLDSSQELASVSYTSFLNGANAAYLGGELIYFRNATQISATQWVLSGLLRGQIGTEAAMGAHAVGEPFVLLVSASMYVAPINLTDIGQKLYFEPYLTNLFGTSPGPLVTVTPKNGRLAPLAPFQFAATKGSAASLQDWTLSWFRRARINYAWTDGADVPLDWQQESYSVTIYNSSGKQINRYTITAAGIEWNGGSAAQIVPVNPSSQSLPPFSWPTKPNFVYNSVMLTNDGFSIGQSVTAVVQQIGDYGVPGMTSSVTFTR